jgi:hypothetical protein
MKLDLGFTPQYLHSFPETSSSGGKKKKEEKPIVYPSIHLEGDSAKTIGCNVETGGEFTALVTFKVVRKSEQAGRKHEYGGETKEGCDLELELRSISSNKLKEDEHEDDEDSAEAAAEKFFGK